MLHQYTLNGYHIVLDTCSGSIHAVDEVAYDMIALWQSTPHEEIVRQMLEKYAGRTDVTRADLLACLDDIGALEKAGKLFTPDTYAGLASEFKRRSNVV